MLRLKLGPFRPDSCFAAAGELRALLVGLALPTEAGPGDPALDGDGLGFWMRELDADKSRGIDADEFYVALSR